MTITSHSLLPIAAAVLALGAVGCAQTGGSSSSSSAPAAPAVKSTAGMNAQGTVVDSSKVEAGSGQQVKGLGGWEGEITGRPGANSRFNRLQIGMSMRQAVDTVGIQPTDQGAYITGKAFIPFYFGSDRHRYEMVFKNQGRLIFAGGSLGDYSGGNLVWIIHNPTEGGYR